MEMGCEGVKRGRPRPAMDGRRSVAGGEIRHLGEERYTTAKPESPPERS